MLLQRWSDYADRLAQPPPGYKPTPIRYFIELDGEGRLVSRRPIDTADPKAKRGQIRPAPLVARTSSVKPLLLADNAEYILGLARGASKPTRVAECHRASLALLDRCAAATAEPALRAVRTFLAKEPLGQLELPEDFDPAGTMTFRVDGGCPIDLPSVQAFWAAENDPAGRDAPVMECLVCGQRRPVLERLQGTIKPVPGGQTSGTSIISANAQAFESYGLEASLIAPTCASCAERFTNAANDLLRDPSRRLVIPDVAAFMFWTREEVGFNLLTHIQDPKPEEVRDLLASVRTGRQRPDVDDTAFYATVLSGSGARTVVRDWIDTTVGEVKRHLSRWFTGQEIVGAFGEEFRPLGLYALAAATVRDPRKDLSAPTIRTLLHAALTGTPVPMGLLAQAVRRNRAEQRVTRQRAALIKLVLRDDAMIQLDRENPDPAYRCGRLLAVLEEIQQAAIPGANTTIVDRFFGTASSAPASVFGRLLRGAQPHLAKIERDKRGAYVALQQRLEEILGGLSGFPPTLPLQQQGLFSLGYYHQRAWDRKQAREASERRKAGLAPTKVDDALADALSDDIEEGTLTDTEEN